MKKTHLYHIVDVSPWPLSTSIGVLLITSGFVCYMHRVINGMFLVLLGLGILILSLFVW
jgi:cytochrome c oxidase subunit 3